MFFICNKLELINIGQLFSHLTLYIGSNTTVLLTKFLFLTVAAHVNNSFELPFNIISFAWLSNAPFFISKSFCHK